MSKGWETDISVALGAPNSFGRQQDAKIFSSITRPA